MKNEVCIFNGNQVSKNRVKMTPNDFIIAKCKEFAALQSKEKVPFKTYLMRDNATGFYKIGKSKNIRQREKSLKTANPLIELIAYSHSDFEKELHSNFEPKHVRGEWFNLKENDVCYIFKKFADDIMENEGLCGMKSLF